MRALRRRSSPVSRTAVLVPGLAASFLLVSVQPVAYQDLVSYLARKSGVDQTWRRHVASLVRPSTTVAGFVFSRPAIAREFEAPRPVLASLSAGPVPDLRRDGHRPGQALGSGMDRAVIYPVPNREAKGDLLLERPQLRLSIGQLETDPSIFVPPADTSHASRFVPAPADDRGDAEHSVLSLGGLQLAAVSPGLTLDDRPAGAMLGLGMGPLATAPQDDAEEAAAPPADGRRFAEELDGEKAGIAIAGNGPIARSGAGFGAPSMPLESAPFRVTTTHEAVPGFDPILGPFATDGRGDRPDSLLARLLGRNEPRPTDATALARPPVASGPSVHPALALGLTGPAHARAERCLAEAVYWEARSEPERGQMAVAQVVLNRAVSGFYPRDVCGVVYQNAHRYLACQFTFACEGRRSLVPTEAGPWTRASQIAKDMMAGRTWLPEVGHATHYHATYVRPWWARSMNRLQQIGIHVFYRPRNWGAGPRIEVARAAGDES